jgi:hypothetical protein
MKNHLKIRIIYPFFLILLTLPFGVSALDQDHFKNAVAQSLKKLGCENFHDSIFDVVTQVLGEKMASLNGNQIDRAITKALRAQFEGRISQEGIEALARQISNFYRFLMVKVGQKIGTSDLGLLKRTLGALRVGDRSNDVSRQLQSEISRLTFNIDLSLQQQSIQCSQFSNKETFAPSRMQIAAFTANVPLSVLGIRTAMATAYQSCEALALKPMTGATPNVQGIVVTGNYPGSWTGKYYKIEDQDALIKTHYYIKDYKPQKGCIDVKKKSMIYDFGGKPYTTSSASSTLNYWKNNGDGSPGLGIDCSGFVFTSLASAGLRLVAGKRTRASDVENFPAAMYVDPQDNGFSCLTKAKMGLSGTVMSGDILATKYHVAIVERVGPDPLAINKYADCSKITYRDFDFVIAQSSPDKGTIGINKFEARDYLSPFLHFGFRGGLEQYARAACEAFHKGTDSTPSLGSFGVSRHKMTSECLQNEIPLEGQSCIESCHELLE